MSVGLIVTDLDGTLLDHDSYSYAEALPALDAIRERGLPLVLASSKTRLEMAGLHGELGLRAPFICENGAAICTPVGDGFELQALAPARDEVLAAIRELREAAGYRFTGFADCDAEGIAGMTGLDSAAAALAGRREFSEPLRWEDSPERLDVFRRELAERGLVAQQGGRFLSVSGPADKGQALARLRAQYGGDELSVVALGDSPNDATMLAAADMAVIIASARLADIEISGPRRVIRTTLPGPAGWRDAILELLSEPGSAMAAK